MLTRHAAAPCAALADRPVVLLHGARETGTTTLVRAMAEESGSRYVTLDDLTMLAAARGGLSRRLHPAAGTGRSAARP